MLLAALVGGLQHMLVSAGEPDNLVVLRKGATNDGSSQVPRDAALAVRALPGIATGDDGEPLVSPEIVNQPFMRTPDGGRENVLVRGVEPVAFAVHRGVRLVGGPRLPAEARRDRDRRRRRAPLRARARQRGGASAGGAGPSSASSTRAARRSTARSGPT